MTYRAELYISPQGKIDVGEFSDLGAAMRACSEFKELLNKYGGSNVFAEIIKEVKPSWRFKAKNGNVLEWKCSECGNIIYGLPTNYCANCGVDMRNEK